MTVQALVDARIVLADRVVEGLPRFIDTQVNAIDMLGCDIVAASGMANGNLAAFLRLGDETNTIAPGLRADLVHLDDDRRVRAAWIGGVREDHGE